MKLPPGEVNISLYQLCVCVCVCVPVCVAACIHVYLDLSSYPVLHCYLFSDLPILTGGQCRCDIFTPKQTHFSGCTRE